MTLHQFLLDSERADISTNSRITAHIRQRVQNIDVLAYKELQDISCDDICDIYMAILFETRSYRAHWRTDAWGEFIKDANQQKISEKIIDQILKNTR